MEYIVKKISLDTNS